MTDKYNEYTNAYNNIKTLRENNKFRYVTLNQPNVLAPIKVGSMCSDEFNFNSGLLIANKKWDVEDTASSCFLNIQNMYSKQLFDEDKLIQSDNIEKKSGLALKVKKSADFTEDKIGYFLSNDIDSYLSNLDEKLSSGIAIELYGYFTPEKSGDHIFKIPVTDVYQLWISNDNAINDYKKDNADINKNSGINIGDKSFKIHLKKNKYYPIRIHLANKSNNDIDGPVLSVIDPNNKTITDNDNFSHFVSLFQGSQPFNKKLQYFGLYRSNNNLNSNNSLFQCYFIESSKMNYDLINKLKVNKPFVYKYFEIPTTITYNSAIYNKSAKIGTDTNVEAPVGAKVNIKNSMWGLDKDRIENHWYTTIEEETDPNIIIDTNTSPYQYQIKEGTKNENKKGNGFYVRKYSGYWNGNTGWFDNAQFIGDETWSNIDYSSVPANTSYIIQANISSGDRWQVRFFMESDDAAKLYVNGSDILNTNYNTGGKYSNLYGSYPDIKNIKIFYGNGSGPGKIKLHHQRRHRSGGRRKRWRFEGHRQMDEMFSASYNLDFPYETKQTKTLNKTTKTYIIPTPTKEVRHDNWVTIPSSIDTKDKVGELVEENKLSVKGDYNNQFTDPAPGYDKNFRLSYNYTQTFDANDPTKNITNKSIYLDKNGQLVIGYDFNETTNKSNISFLTSNELCEEDKNCKYSLVLENNGSVSIYNNGNQTVWNREYLNLDKNTIQKIQTNPDWINNPERRSSLDIGEKLSPSGVSELISENGKYKLIFINGKLTIVYSILAYDVVNENNINVHYTTSQHKDRDNQYFFLYRVKGNELSGKKFLESIDKINNTQKLEHLPNNYSNILQYNGYESNNNVYPLFSNNDYSKISDNSTSDPIVINNSYKAYSSNLEDCENTCNNNNDCEHFFFMNTRTGNKCVQDTTSNSIPIFTKQKNENISESTIYKKKYLINSNCKYEDQPNILFSDSVDKYSNYNVLYDSKLTNDPNETFYCSSEIYKQNNKIMNNNFKKKNNLEAFQTKYSSIEGYDTNSYVEKDEIIDKKITPLEEKIDKFRENQKKINTNNKNYQTSLTNFKSDYQTLYGNDIYKDDGIPDIYKKKLDTKVKGTVEDARQNDTKTLLIYENTMYTVATIAAATIVVTAIVLARE